MSAAPDPAFVAFFAGDWQRLLEATEVPGMQGASWDRRAAWLVWCARKPPASLLPPVPSPLAGLLPR